MIEKQVTFETKQWCKFNMIICEMETEWVVYAA
jgi:hypothetical protein